MTGVKFGNYASRKSVFIIHLGLEYLFYSSKLIGRFNCKIFVIFLDAEKVQTHCFHSTLTQQVTNMVDLSVTTGQKIAENLSKKFNFKNTPKC